MLQTRVTVPIHYIIYGVLTHITQVYVQKKRKRIWDLRFGIKEGWIPQKNKIKINVQKNRDMWSGWKEIRKGTEKFVGELPFYII